MNKKVLILYPYSNHDKMVENMVIHLRKNGVNVDAFNTSTFRFLNKDILVSLKTSIKISRFVSLLPGIFKKVTIRVFGLNRLLKLIANNYDVIDLHVFHRGVDSIIDSFAKTKTVKVTIWGSDFYRADTARREKQRELYRKCDIIQVATEAIKDDFLEYYKEFEERIFVANFGLYMFDVIDTVKKNGFKRDGVTGRLNVVCGYNGSKHQRHDLIISALDKLNKADKDKLFLIFPMTYGASEEYILSIDKKLREINIPYTIYSDNMSDEEVARLRLTSDVVINIQTTDAFSGSLQEHLYSGSVLLVGDWLPYSILDKIGVFYMKCSLDSIKVQIENCINNINTYKERSSQNISKMHELSSWDEAGKRMSVVYL